MPKSELNRSFNLLHITSFALGAIIGWATFVLPTDMMLPRAGSMGTIVGIVLSMMCLMLLTFNYGLMIREYPKAGGTFYYCSKCFGPKLTFVCGWMLILCYLSLVANNLSAIAVIARFFMPGVLENIYLYDVRDFAVYLEEIVLTIMVMLFFSVVNLKGAGKSGGLQNLLVLLLTLGIFAAFIYVVIAGDVSLANLRPLFNQDDGALSSVLFIMAISPFLFIGFDTITQTAEEFSFKPILAQRIMMVSIVIGALLYIAALLTVALPWPYEELLKICQEEKAQGGASWGYAIVAEAFLGKAGALIILLPVLGAVLSGVNGFSLVCTRLMFSMAREGYLPKTLSTLHPNYQAPKVAIILVFIVAALSAFSGRGIIPTVVDASSVGACSGYLITCLCAYKILKGRPSLPNTIYNYAGILYSVACLLLLMIIPGSPSRIGTEAYALVVAWLVFGALLYFKLMGNNKNPEVE